MRCRVLLGRALEGVGVESYRYVYYVPLYELWINVILNFALMGLKTVI